MLDSLDTDQSTLTETRAELAELRKRSKLLKETERIAKLGSWSLDLVSGALEWSDEVFRIFEIDPNRFEATYDGFLNTVHPNDREMVNAAYTQSLETHKPYEITHRLLMQDGRVKWVVEKCETDFASDGTPLRSHGMVQDVTEYKVTESKLLDTKNRLRATLDAVPDLLFEIDGDGRYRGFHAHRAELLAAAPDQLIGKTISEVLPPNAANICLKALEEAERNGRSQGAIYSLDFPNGRHWFELSVAAVQDPHTESAPGSKDSLRFVAGARDITERTLAEEAQRVSEAKWRSLVENAPDFILTIDRNLRYTYINHAQPGLHVDQFIGRDVLEAVPEEDRERMRRIYEEVFATGKRAETEVRSLIGADTVGWYRVHIGPIFESGRINALMIISADITAQKKTEEELRIAATAFECQEGIAVLDANFNYLRVNRAFVAITGYNQEELQGRSVAMHRSPRQPSDFYANLRVELQQSGRWHGEFWHIRKGGESYLGRVTITAVRNDNHVITHFIATITDITDVHLREQRRIEHETAHRNSLVREVHHRIKNNLQGITGLLRQTALAHPELADAIHQAIGQVQSISVIHGLQGRATGSSVQLCDLSTAIAEEIGRLWQANIDLAIDPNWQTCEIAESEAVPVALILNELIVNAVKHSTETNRYAHIELRTPTQETAEVVIRNVGQLDPSLQGTEAAHSGLQLVSALMPLTGAKLSHTQEDKDVVTVLSLAPPVIRYKQ